MDSGGVRLGVAISRRSAVLAVAALTLATVIGYGSGDPEGVSPGSPVIYPGRSGSLG
jgi:hypothetical protein